MRKIFLLALLLFQLSFVQAQDGTFRLESNTVLIDEHNNTISLPLFLKRISNENLQLDIQKDKNGKTTKITILKLTKKDNETQKLPSKIGQKAPTFKVLDIDENTIDTSKLKGKVIVLNFWFTSCMPCIEEIPALNRLTKKYKNNPNVVFLAITFNRTDKVKRFLSRTTMNYTVIPYENPTCTKFSVTGFPTNMVIDKNGNYQWISLGGFGAIDKEIDQQIQIALQK